MQYFIKFDSLENARLSSFFTIVLHFLLHQPAIAILYYFSLPSAHNICTGTVLRRNLNCLSASVFVHSCSVEHRNKRTPVLVVLRELVGTSTRHYRVRSCRLQLLDLLLLLHLLHLLLFFVLLLLFRAR